jgi:O-antigen/teichoic acid export membrane protein
MKIVNVLFLIILENFVLDCGMGFLSTSFFLMAIFYTILFGGLQTGISKLVSIRNSKGLNSNSSRILKPTLMYVIIIGVLLFVLSFFVADAFCMGLCRTSFPASVIKVMFLFMLINGIIDVICGYQNGNGNAVIMNIANLLRMILPILIVFFILPAFTEYGQKVSALLQNTSATSAYMALGIACVYLLTSLLVLVAVLLLCIRMRIPHQEGRNMRTMDSKRMMYSCIFSSCFKISIHQIFPVLSIATVVFLYLSIAGKFDIPVESVFINIGILFVKLLLPASFILFVFSEYIIREKYRLHMDYKKGDPKTALIRSQYMIKNSFFMLLPPSVILTFLADPLVKVFFSGQYNYSAKVLQTGGFLVLLAGVVHALNAIMKSSNMELPAFGMQFLAFAVQVIYLILSLNHAGADSMNIIYSFYVYYGVQLVFNFMCLYRNVRFDLMDILMKLGKYGAASIVMMVLFVILDKFVMMNVFLFLLSIFFGYLLYYLTLIALKAINKKDEMALKRTLNYYPVAFLRSRLRL